MRSLTLLQVVVVGVEDLAGVGDVEVVLGLLRPGQLDQPLQVGADDAVLGGGRGQFLQPRELALGGFAGVLGQFGLLDPLAQLVDLGLLLVPLPQLVLDRFQLLAQEELALAFVDLRTGPGTGSGCRAGPPPARGRGSGRGAAAARRRRPPPAAPASPRWRSAGRRRSGGRGPRGRRCWRPPSAAPRAGRGSAR